MADAALVGAFASTSTIPAVGLAFASPVLDVMVSLSAMPAAAAVNDDPPALGVMESVSAMASTGGAGDGPLSATDLAWLALQ